MLSVTLRDNVLKRGAEFTLGPVSLALEKGSRTAIVGPSGCGKSTLLRCIAGLEHLDSGSIDLGDRRVTNGRVEVAPSDRGIGFVFQHGALWPHMTALEQIRFAAPRLKKSDALALLERVGLGHLRKRKPAQMSGGEGQRLALARAIAAEPDILLLDEPLASVDVHQRDGLSVLIRTLAEERGLTVLVVTHDRDEALAMADDIVVLRDGKVVEQGSVRELMVAPRTAFTASFLGRATCFPILATDNGVVHTPFGPVPATVQDGMALVVMPGDVVLHDPSISQDTVNAEDKEDDRPRFRVRGIRPDSFGLWYASVEVDGRTLLIPSTAELEENATVALEFAREARFLPYDVNIDGDLAVEIA